MVPSDTWAWWQVQRFKAFAVLSLNYSSVLTGLAVLIIFILVTGVIQMLLWFMGIASAIAIAGILEGVSFVLN